MQASPSGTPGQTVLYQAASPWTDQVKSTRRKLAELCGKHLNRPVRIQTIDGHIYDGILLGTDGCHLQLAVQQAQTPYGQRFFNPYSAAAITTLVLYELLVITLLI
ncbi:LSm family protein [Cohnella fermenti]|uniref:Acetyl-CoA acetyltransferase n=1 Tax=Cohnella fermenti TaxID=2565925 RepID=A0A4S4C8S4_9BACL|nr:acetyl-CoA acetyltransferase [Cohnella fermenti]THF84070.1 acetyl-CoA acetyltransferase [Cohnella fermenti]